MNIDQLTIQNFLTIGDETTLNLADQGLVLIEGVNEEDSSAISNGAGKSSICDALCWALWGTTARGKTGDGVINNKRKKDCRVSVLVSDDANEWRISRHRKHAVGKNTTVIEHRTNDGMIVSAWNDISKASERETQAEIALILGSSYEVFKASIYAGQEDAVDLPKKTDKELKMLIEQAAGIERVERAYKIINGRVNETQAEIDRTRLRVESAERMVRATDEHIDELVTRHETFIANEATAKATLKTRADALKRELLTDGAALKEIDVAGLRTAQAAAKTEADSFSGVVKLHEEAKQLASQAHIDFNRAADACERVKREVMDCAGKAKNAHEAVKGNCSECGKPHTPEEVDAYRKVWTERAKEAKTRHDAALRVMAAAKHKCEELEAKEAEAKAAIPDMTEVSSRYSKVQAALNDYAMKVSAFKTKKESLDKLVAEAAAVTPDPYNELIEREREKRAKHLAERDDAVKAVHELEGRLEVLKNAAEVMGPAGVRAHILDTVTPFLNDRTNEYLSILSDGNIQAVWSTLGKTAKGELREKFNIAVSCKTGGGDFDSLSGGEKRKPRLATMLALQDLVASRATKPINLWIGDELDQALDRAGLERLMSVLERRATEKGTVIVISHNSLRDWIDNVATVTKGGDGLSTVTGALSA